MVLLYGEVAMSRTKELGQFGETLMVEALTKEGYACEIFEGNHPLFDILAVRGDDRRIISIKTRNATTSKNTEKKDGYSLLYSRQKADPEARVRAAAATARACNATAYWACVRVDVEPQIYDIYWGLIDDLPNKKVVPMSPTDRGGHERLAEGVFDQRIEVGWSNVALRYKIAAAT